MAEPEDKKKKNKTKEFDSSKFIDTEPTLDEAAKGTAIVSWGRMNPMTAGHEKLVKKVLSVAKAEKGIPHIFLTHSVDKKKNPLTYEDKLNFAQRAFGPVVKKSNAKTIFQLMKQLEKRFNRVVLVAGSDRVKEFNDTLNKYNGKEYKFDEIKVVSAGQRDEDADDVSGISGTKMRGYAATDMKKFVANLPKKIQGDAEEIAALVRKGMNMSESEEIHIDDMEPLEERVLDRQQRRKMAINMKKFRHKMARGRERAKRKTANMETLKKRARKAAINLFKQKFAKNRRYADMSVGEKQQVDKRIEKISKKRIDAIAKKLLPKVKEKERARKLSLMNKKENVELDTRFELFMEDYYKGVPNDKKDDREAHFKRKAEKPGDGADKDSNYTDAPGDIGKDGERVKTKVSKHTKKYKDMFGEGNMWGQRITKKPHMLLDRNGKTKFDKRFKMYKPKNEEYEDISEELLSLIESTEEFSLELNEDPTASLKKKAEKTGMPMGVLRQVYNRGVAAWKSGHRPGTTPEQWGHARVNSFVTKSSGTWGKADKDLAAKVRGSSKNEEVELDELDSKTYRSYIDKAQKSQIDTMDKKKQTSKDSQTMRKRSLGIATAKMKQYGDKRSLKQRIRNEEGGAGDEGTNKLVNKYKKDTPNCSD